MKKKYITAIIVILLLTLFFWPRTNNRWDDSFTAHGDGYYKNMDCTCIGFKAIKPGLTRSDTQIVWCYGIPVSCEYSCAKIINQTWQHTSCDNIN